MRKSFCNLSFLVYNAQTFVQLGTGRVHLEDEMSNEQSQHSQ